jgi:hypothetical protein
MLKLKAKVERQRDVLKKTLGAHTLVARLFLFCILPLVFSLSGCRQDMQDQPRYTAYQRSEFFDNKMASRPPVEGTVARGDLRATLERTERGRKRSL